MDTFKSFYQVLLIFFFFLFFVTCISKSNDSISDFQILRTLKLRDVNTIENLLIDSNRGIMYAGASSSEGSYIIAVDIQNFKEINRIQLFEDEINIQSAVIDLYNFSAYFGTNVQNPKIVKIALYPTLNRFSSFDMSKYAFSFLKSGTILTSNIPNQFNYAYFGGKYGQTSTTMIAKFRLNDFVLESYLQLNSQITELDSAVISNANNALYFGIPGGLVQINLDKFSYEKTLFLNTSLTDKIQTASVNPLTQTAYLGSSKGSIYDVKLSALNFTHLDNFISISSSVLFPEMNLGFFGSAKEFIQVNLTIFQTQGLISFDGLKQGAVLDPPTASVIFANNDELVQIQLFKNCTNVACSRHGKCIDGVCRCDEDWGGPDCSIVNCSYNRCNFHGNCINSKCECYDDWTGETCEFPICKSNCSGHGVCISQHCVCSEGWFGKECDFGLNYYHNFPNFGSFASSAIDITTGFAYFGTMDSPGRVVKVNLNDFSFVGSITLQYGEDALTSAAIDVYGGYLYFGTFTSPAQVIKIDLNTFKRVDSLILNQNNDDELVSAVIDLNRNYLLFGTNSYNLPLIRSKVIRIQLSDFTYKGSLFLGSFESFLTSACIDTSTGFAYFGTGYTITPGNAIVQIDVDKLVETNSVVLSSSQYQLSSCSLDSTNGYAYFTTQTKRVVKLRLSDLNVVGEYIDSNALQSIVSSTSLQIAWVGSSNNIVRLNTTTLKADTSIPISGAKSTGIYDSPSGKAYFSSSNTIYQIQLFNSCSSDCNRQGECLNGVCNCFSGWTGQYCDKFTPPGISTPTASNGIIILFVAVTGLYLFFIGFPIYRIAKLYAYEMEGRALTVPIKFYIVVFSVTAFRVLYFILTSLNILGKEPLSLTLFLCTCSYLGIFSLFVISAYSWMTLPLSHKLIKWTIKSKAWLIIETIIIVIISVLFFFLLLVVDSSGIQFEISFAKMIIFMILGLASFIFFIVFSAKFFRNTFHLPKKKKMQRIRLRTWNLTLVLAAGLILQALIWFLVETNWLEHNFYSEFYFYYLMFFLSDLFSFVPIMFLAFHYMEYYCYLQYMKPEKKPLINTEDEEDPFSSTIDLPDLDQEEKTLKTKFYDWNLLSAALIILVILLLVIFFIIPRTPTWRLVSVTFNDFHFNSDFTSTLSFNTKVEVQNDGFGQITLQNVQVAIYYSNNPCGITSSSNLNIGPRNTQISETPYLIRRIPPLVGRTIKQAMLQNDGTVSFDFKGKGEILSTGNVLRQIQILCSLSVDLTKLPQTVTGASCVEQIDVFDQ